MGTKIRFRKTLYASKTELAEAFGISGDLLYGRLIKGWSIGEALGVVKRKRPVRDGKAVVYRGQRYSSITSFALAFGQTPNTVRARIEVSKWTLAQAIGDEEAPISKIRGRRRRTTVITRKGTREFGTFKEAAEWCGVDRRVAHARMKIGWSLEQALEQEDPPEQAYAGYGVIYLVRNVIDGRCYVGQTMQRLKRRWKGHLKAARDGASTPLAAAMGQHGVENFVVERLGIASNRADLNRLEGKWIKKLGTLVPNGYNATDGGSGNVKGIHVEYRGVVYGSYTQLAGCYGLDGETLRIRLKRGVDLKTAVETGNLHHQECVVDGRTFGSRAAAAKHYGVTTQKICSRMVRGWTFRQALGVDKRKPCKSAPKTIRINGHVFPSFVEAAKHFGLDPETTRARVNKGWTLAEAFNLSARKKKTVFHNSQPITVAGVEYPSLSAAARANDQPLSRIQVRLKYGWSIENAFSKQHRDAGKPKHEGRIRRS